MPVRTHAIENVDVFWNYESEQDTLYEQLGVAPLLFGGAFEVLFSSRYAATRMADAVAATVVGRLPLVEGATESSLWLRKIA